VSFFWLNYHYRDGQFAGAVVIEATALIIARMQAAVFGLDFGVDFAGGHEIDHASAQQIPESMIGRWLDHADLRRLRLLLTKKPQAPSVKVRPGGKPRRTDDTEMRRRPKPSPPLRCRSARRGTPRAMRLKSPRRERANSGAPPVLVAFGDYDAKRLWQFASVHGGALAEKWQLFGAASLFSAAAE
jgi:hypothetical protein